MPTPPDYMDVIRPPLQARDVRTLDAAYPADVQSAPSAAHEATPFAISKPRVASGATTAGGDAERVLGNKGYP